MAAAFTFVALAPLVRHHPMRLWAVPIAGVFLLVTAAAPRALEPLNRAWFQIGVSLGRVTSPIVLAIFYYVVLTPLALLMRATGKDVLSLRWVPGAESYWIPRKPPGPEPSSLRRQF